ncbi:MAG TPA: hypothetical protein VFA21_15325, partial [Pyrinomonadaceae bacterium]|nr:hypothetical protein [Pyrinomonadaceae bacterium]
MYPGGDSGSAYSVKQVYSRPESSTTNAGYVDVQQCTSGPAVGQCDTGAALLSHEIHYYYGSPRLSFNRTPVDYTGWQEGKEYKAEVYDPQSGALLRKVESTWQQPVDGATWPLTQAEPNGSVRANNPQVTQVLTTLADTNQVSEQTFSYDQYGNRTDTYEYDYGAGAAGAFVRRTHTDFVTTAAYVNADANQAVGASLRSLPSQQWVSSDAAGNSKASLTTYAYDQYALTDCPGITGHDTTYTTGFTTRGNVTSVTSYANAAGGTGAVTSSSHYDIAGNVISSTDPNGNTSTVSFADSFCNDGGLRCNGTYTANTFALPASVTSPVPDPTGQYGSATALVASTIYDFYTGLTYSTTDANNKTTTLYYADSQGSPDPLDRLRAVVRPDGSRADYDYGDTVGNLYVHTLTDLDSSRRAESKQFFDGMGRAYRKAIYENYDTTKPWITVDTEYDALGRVKRSSMSYRAAEGAALFSTDKWAETAYDALGRVTTVTTKPDGAFVTTSYSGNSVTVTDQHDTSSAGHSRKSVTDALDRLTSVYEDPSNLNYLTNYTYDVLGNLRTVTQGTQTRTFVYDSLSRLTSATNPESGTVGYTYDNDGNLQTKTDARGVIATYAYDHLNRNITVTYSGGGTTTPTVSRYYDSATNGKGHLYRTEAAAIAQSTFATYDVMGRPTQYQQKFWVSGAWGQAYTTQLGYNLAGGVTSENYPSGHSVSYNYDAAGRLGDNGSQAAFSGNLGDGAQRTYASQLVYDEKGGMNQERFGTDTPVYNKHLYNSRGQLAEIRVSTYAFTDQANSTNWNRGAIINQYSAHGSGASGGGADNNGNLREQDLFIPNFDGAGYDQSGNYGLGTQSFTYDSLNRLSSASESSAAPWTQSYTYDRWGNRTINASATTNAPKPQYELDITRNDNRLYLPGDAAITDPTQRRMLYDLAGNQTRDLCMVQADPNTLCTRTYDAENRMTQAQLVSGQVQTAAYTYDAD